MGAKLSCRFLVLLALKGECGRQRQRQTEREIIGCLPDSLQRNVECGMWCVRVGLCSVISDENNNFRAISSFVSLTLN